MYLLKSISFSGWVRFKLNQQSTTPGNPSTSDNSEWTVAYYLTRADRVRSILDHGQPLPIRK